MAALVAAVESGSVRTAAWLRQVGCPLQAKLYLPAIARGDLPVVTWLLQPAAPACS